MTANSNTSNDMNSQKQTLTFISRLAPYGRNEPQLCLEMALAAAVFEQKVNYVFLDDGVFQLLTQQNAEHINSKTLANMLEAMDLYGIENVYVDEQSLEQRKLQAADLIIAATPLNRTSLTALIDQSDCVFNL
jgi:tRNA 2-thiouridine synthesizing protein C